MTQLRLGRGGTGWFMLSVWVGFVLSTAASAAPNAPAPSIPERFGQYNSLPEWVSAGVAVRDGILSSESLGAYAPRLREAALMNPPARPGAVPECRSFSTWTSDHFEARGTLPELTASAKHVIAGRVIASEQGFHRGTPGTLLEISGSMIKGAARSRRWFVFYPVANISTVDGAICARPVGDFVPPEPGDRVMVFSIVGNSGTDDFTVFFADPTHELIHESAAAAKIRVPNALKRMHGPPSFDDIERNVRSLAATEGKRP